MRHRFAVFQIISDLALATAVGSGSPSYHDNGPCHAHCALAGAAPGNGSVYRDLGQFQGCRQTMFLALSFYDPVDSPDALHHFRVFTVWNADLVQVSGTQNTPSQQPPGM